MSARSGRPSVARIDLDALRHNAAVASRHHGGRLLAVLKADAYGHGAVQCAHALHGLADGFGVAFLDEAVALREAGITAPILVLEGPFDGAELGTMARLGLWAVVHHADQLRMVEAGSGAAGLHVWLKVDSGMHRAGFAPSEVAAAHARLRASGKVGRITWMSHFARADEPASEATARQMAVFDAATADLPGARSLCNSAGVLGWPAARRDWARPGILLYGADPMPGGGHGLRPVMQLSSTVFAERTLQRGESLGYGAAFTAERPTRVGLVAIGYADGYPRSAPTGTPLGIDGQRSRTLGRVSMDMLAVDLDACPGTGVGSEVELWGPRIDVNLVAAAAGTIAYELLCNVKRVRKEWVGPSAARCRSTATAAAVAA